MTANAVAISELKIDKEQLISVFKLAEEGKLIEKQLKSVRITEVAKGVLDANPQIVEQYRGGKVTVIGFFVGQVMKQTQ